MYKYITICWDNRTEVLSEKAAKKLIDFLIETNNVFNVTKIHFEHDYDDDDEHI